MKDVFVYVSESEAQTRALAARIAAGLRANDCLALTGDFGSGKTVFVKGLAEGLKVRKKQYVCSPSFVILKIYQGRRPLYHFDLYRLGRSRDFEDIGLAEYLRAGGVAAVEWAQRARSFFPDDTLFVSLRVRGRHRRVLRFSTRSRRLRRVLRRQEA